MMYLSAIPAYGRDYKSAKEVLADWLDHKDFLVMAVTSSGYVNIDDLPDDTTLNIRYNKQTRVLPVNKKGVVKP